MKVLDFVKFVWPIGEGDSFADVFERNMASLLKWQASEGVKHAIVPRSADESAKVRLFTARRRTEE